MQKLSKHRRNAAMGILAVAITGIVFSSILLINNPSNPGTAPDNTLEVEPGEKPLLTEFGDFQCPHCANFAEHPSQPWNTTSSRREPSGSSTGTIPSWDPKSFNAAEAAECARDQGEFNKYHLELYRLTSHGKSHTPGTAAGNRSGAGIWTQPHSTNASSRA